jgi:hypothetical protein
VEAVRQGLDVDSLRDNWGELSQFESGVDGTSYTFAVKTSGPNKRFEKEGSDPSDDFALWRFFTDYFAETRAKNDDALGKNNSPGGLVWTQDAAQRRAKAATAASVIRAARRYAGGVERTPGPAVSHLHSQSLAATAGLEVQEKLWPQPTAKISFLVANTLRHIRKCSSGPCDLSHPHSCRVIIAAPFSTFG